MRSKYSVASAWAHKVTRMSGMTQRTCRFGTILFRTGMCLDQAFARGLAGYLAGKKYL